MEDEEDTEADLSSWWSLCQGWRRCWTWRALPNWSPQTAQSQKHERLLVKFNKGESVSVTTFTCVLQYFAFGADLTALRAAAAVALLDFPEHRSP